MDGTLQHLPELLTELLAAGKDADLVVASRYLPGGSGDRSGSLPHQAVTWSGKALASALFARARRCTDPMSHYFLFRRAVVKDVALRPEGDRVLLEILVRGRWSRLTEVPCLSAGRAPGVSTARPATRASPA